MFQISFPDGLAIEEGVNGSRGMNESNGVNRSQGVNWSDGVNKSNGVDRSDGVSRSSGISNSMAVHESFGILNSYGVYKALFLVNKPREYSIFGKTVSEERFTEVAKQLEVKLNDWYPSFSNMDELYKSHGEDWSSVPFDEITSLPNSKAWESMPKAAVEYVKSLPEFDAAMFKVITGIE